MIREHTWIIGPLLSLAGVYLAYRRKDVGRWLRDRRIDKVAEKDLGSCELCGQPLRRIRTLSGKRQGQEAAVCRHYPECKFVRWGV